MNRKQFCIDAALKVLKTRHGRILLNEELETFNYPLNPVTEDEILGTLEDIRTSGSRV